MYLKICEKKYNILEVLDRDLFMSKTENEIFNEYIQFNSNCDAFSAFLALTQSVREWREKIGSGSIDASERGGVDDNLISTSVADFTYLGGVEIDVKVNNEDQFVLIDRDFICRIVDRYDKKTRFSALGYAECVYQLNAKFETTRNDILYPNRPLNGREIVRLKNFLTTKKARWGEKISIPCEDMIGIVPFVGEWYKIPCMGVMEVQKEYEREEYIMEGNEIIEIVTVRYERTHLFIGEVEVECINVDETTDISNAISRNNIKLFDINSIFLVTPNPNALDLGLKCFFPRINGSYDFPLMKK